MKRYVVVAIMLCCASEGGYAESTQNPLQFPPDVSVTLENRLPLADSNAMQALRVTCDKSDAKTSPLVVTDKDGFVLLEVKCP